MPCDVCVCGGLRGTPIPSLLCARYTNNVSVFTGAYRHGRPRKRLQHRLHLLARRCPKPEGMRV